MVPQLLLFLPVQQLLRTPEQLPPTSWPKFKTLTLTE
jgi:hypothetical protein